MRILRPGNKKSWKTQATCTGMLGTGREVYQEGCGALLEVEASDLFTQNVEAEKGPTTRTAFECPECGTVTAVDKVPGHVDRLSKPVRLWPPKRLIRAVRRRSRLDRV